VYDTTAVDISAVLNNFRQTLIRYEGQVEQLIRENEQLKKEIESLRPALNADTVSTSTQETKSGIENG
jgi:regulator of replication initiation timing